MPSPIIIGGALVVILIIIGLIIYFTMGGEETPVVDTGAAGAAAPVAAGAAAPVAAGTTPAVVPAFALEPKTTPDNDAGGGNSIYLDRHDLQCDKKPINQFNLVSGGCQ